MDDPEFDDVEYQDFHGHIAELFRRSLYVLALSNVMGAVAFLLSAKLTRAMYATAGLIGAANEINTVLTLSDKILMGALVALLSFHYLVVFNIWAYVSPGLYPEEKKTFWIALVWAYAAPVLALFFLAIYSWVVSDVTHRQVLEMASLRAWLVRFYLITTLATFLLTLPRQKRTLTFSVYAVVCLLVLLLPNHVFDTLIVLLTGLCLIFSFGNWLLLSIWSDDDVKRTRGTYKVPERYLG